MRARLSRRVSYGIFKGRPWGVLLSCLLWLGSSSLAAQSRSLPRQMPKDPGTLPEAGIGSYQITKQGHAAEVDGFDEEGALLVTCTAQWLEDSKRLTCTMSDGGQYRATWYDRHVKFEDLASDEHIILRFKGQPGAVREPRATAQERGWTIDGMKTWEEVERDWGRITPIFGHLMGEVELTLGIASEARQVQ